MDNCRYSSLLTVSIWIISGRFFEAGALHLQFAFPIFDRPQTRVLLTHSLNNFPNQPEFAFLSKFSYFLQTKIEKYGKMKRQLCVLILAALGEAKKKQKKERAAQEFFQCRAKQNCGDCIQTSPKCAWCEGTVIPDYFF